MEGKIERESKASIYFKRSIENKKFNSAQKDWGETRTEAMSDRQENQEKGHDLTAMVTGARMPPSF